MRKMKVLVFALLMARPTHGSDDHAEIVVPFSEDVKTVSSISTVTLKTLTRDSYINTTTVEPPIMQRLNVTYRTHYTHGDNLAYLTFPLLINRNKKSNADPRAITCKNIGKAHHTLWDPSRILFLS